MADHWDPTHIDLYKVKYLFKVGQTMVYVGDTKEYQGKHYKITRVPDIVDGYWARGIGVLPLNHPGWNEVYPSSLKPLECPMRERRPR